MLVLPLDSAGFHHYPYNGEKLQPHLVLSELRSLVLDATNSRDDDGAAKK
jgi:hypothetical protein